MRCHNCPQDLHSARYLKSAGVVIMSGAVDTVLEIVRRVFVEPIGRLGAVLVAATVALSATHRARTLATHGPGRAGGGRLRSLQTSTVRDRHWRRGSGTDQRTRWFCKVLYGRHGHGDTGRAPGTPVFHPRSGLSADGGRECHGPAPFQSTEGLSIGVDLTVRWPSTAAALRSCRRLSR